MRVLLRLHQAECLPKLLGVSQAPQIPHSCAVSPSQFGISVGGTNRNVRGDFTAQAILTDYNVSPGRYPLAGDCDAALEAFQHSLFCQEVL